MPSAQQGEPAGDNLLYTWLLFAVGAAGVAGLLAVFVALARVPGVQVLPSAQAFYTVLVGHVAFSLIVWLLSFVAVTGVYTATLGPGISMRAGWGGLGLAGLGSMMLLVPSLAGWGRPIVSDYVPVLNTPAFLAGYALFAAGIALTLGNLVWSAVRQRSKPLPLPLHGMVSVAATFGVTIVALLLGIVTVEPRTHQAMFWGAGHALQYVYAATMAVAWYVLAADLGATPPAPRLARFAFTLYPILALPAPLMYVAFDPVSVPKLRGINLLLGSGVSVPTLIHLTLVSIAIIAVARRPRAARPVLVWHSPGTVALVFSVLFYLLGGVLAPIGSQGTLRVTAHYHAILVGGVTMVFMGMAYRLMDAMGWSTGSRRAATLQLYLFGTGVLSTVLILAWAGMLGAPRKMYGGALQGAAWSGAMNVMGLAAGLAALGGGIFVVKVLVALLRTRSISRPVRAVEPLAESLAP